MNNSKNNPSWFSNFIQQFAGDKDDRALLLEKLKDAHKHGIIDAEALTMIEGVFQVSEMRVRDIMVPRAHMVVLHDDMSVVDMLPLIASSGHSRFPVIDENLDEIVGILLAKDLSRYNDEKSRDEFELKDILRPAVFVPESKRLNVLLKDFRSSRNHMAIVIDEYGGVAGLVTIEDVLEQIVGSIDDEHDDADAANIQRHGYHRYSVRGLTPISDFNEFFDADLNDDQFDTIAGFVTHEIGHLPERGEEVTVGNFQFKVISANSRRINNLQVTMQSSSASSGD
ncbi:MAG: CBS domain-containing protein [Gammaproteobacteria bacterium]|nr:CBS domain-containing protein [Gammaproteobacteria bacterium]